MVLDQGLWPPGRTHTTSPVWPLSGWLTRILDVYLKRLSATEATNVRRVRYYLLCTPFSQYFFCISIPSHISRLLLWKIYFNSVCRQSETNVSCVMTYLISLKYREDTLEHVRIFVQRGSRQWTTFTQWLVCHKRYDVSYFTFIVCFR